MSGKKRQAFNAWALMSTIASQLAGSILAGLFLGKWIDGQVGTFPLFLVIGLLLGLATGVYGTIRLVKHLSEEKEEDSDD